MHNRYKIGSSDELHAYIYVLKWTTKLVISDIDGTITKSDVLGHLLPAMGWDWSHAGIARLLTDIDKNGYQVGLRALWVLGKRLVLPACHCIFLMFVANPLPAALCFLCSAARACGVLGNMV